VAGVDGLTGCPAAIRAADPPTEGPRRVAPWVRAAGKDVSAKDRREVIKDLQATYPAAPVPAAEQASERFTAKWDGKDPTMGKPWRRRWAGLVALLEFPPEIGQASDTAKAITSVTSAIGEFTGHRKRYPSAGTAHGKGGRKSL
jgi:transposase-like protein